MSFQIYLTYFKRFKVVSAAVLDLELRHLNLREYLFSAEEESLVEEVKIVLKPMKIATALVSGEKQPTASKILPTLAKIRKEMAINETLDSQVVKEMKQNVIDLNKRYKDQSVSSFLLKATFLDPRYKSLHNIAKEGAVFVTKQAIRDMCIKVAESKSVRESTEANTSAPDMLCLPSLPASAAVKEEPPAEITASSSQDYEPPKKKS